jgi:hypothetical protein
LVLKFAAKDKPQNALSKSLLVFNCRVEKQIPLFMNYSDFWWKWLFLGPQLNLFEQPTKK